MNTTDFIERFIFKITSGRFLFTLAIIGVFIYLAVKCILPMDFTKEIILVGLYAYFTKQRPIETNPTTK